MNPYYEDEHVTLYHGDCIEVLSGLPDASVHSVVTDPPYELGFMGKAWDGSGIAYNVALWRECLRVLKPGGHLLSFGGTRTWHRMACAVEDAGFEIRDSISWLYSTGFPKSLDVSKAIDKAAGAEREVTGTATRRTGNATYDKRPSRPTGLYASDDYDLTAPATPAAQQWQGFGTALKPAHEPIVCARKPLVGTVAANVQEHGTGALNIDGCRVTSADKLVRPFVQRDDNEVFGKGLGAGVQDEPSGRWPTNVCLDDSQAAVLDAQSGTCRSAGDYAKGARGLGAKAGPASIPIDGLTSASYADSGGASRFFPTFRYEAKAPGTERPTADGVAHPTVKPVELMRWLCRLVTPPGGTVLEPFAGSGTTLQAARAEGFDVIGIEREADYLPLIKQRLARVGSPVNTGAWPGHVDTAGQVSMFDLLGGDAA